MEKPPRLKVDTELVVGDGDIESGTNSGSNTESNTDRNFGATAGTASIAPPPTVVGGENAATSSPPKQSRSPRDLQAQRDAKKRDEQEFLAAYKKRELFVRVRFAVVAILLIGGFFLASQSVFAPDRKAAMVGFHFAPAILSAFAGERDAAYFQISTFPFDGDESKRTALLNSREAILGKAIADLENSGRTAIFTRLGTEQMLVTQGQRERGLKYGDYLIKKYPDLPSNYCWRARMDFDNSDYAKSIAEFHQFAALVKNGSPQSQKAWRNEFGTAVWSCIDAGRYSEATNFLNTAKKYGGNPGRLQELQSAILLGHYDHLDISELQKTDLWNADLDHFSKSLLTAASHQTENMSFYDDEKDSISFDVALRSQNFSQMQPVLENLRPYKWLRYQYVVDTAEMDLAKGNPKQALATIREKVRGQSELSSAELSYLEATSLIRLRRLEEALTVIDKGLEFYKLPGAVTGRFYLPFFTLKAQALSGLGRQEQALEVCQQVIAGNPEMIAPRLLKMQILQSQGNQPQASKVHDEISKILTATLAAGSNR
jgi:tetratricopeptide (TPR) repeat protein